MHHNQKNKQFFCRLKRLFLPFMRKLRGAVLEWMERLGYSAESRRKVEAGLRHQTTGKVSM